jgi:hypothetical protein
MNARQLQDAIDKARIFVLPQLDYKTTPSNELKANTIEYIKKLQEIQVARAAMVLQPRLIKENP